MSALDDIRADQADALNGVSGLSSYARVPGSLNTPAAVVAPDGIEYSTDFDGGATYRFPIQFLATLADWGTAQDDLDGFVSHDSAAIAALHDDTTFETRVVGMENYGLTTFAGTDYLGAQVIVEVIV